MLETTSCCFQKKRRMQQGSAAGFTLSGANEYASLLHNIITNLFLGMMTYTSTLIQLP